MGFNTDKYKYFIDLAAANKIRYTIIDGGWTPQLDSFKIRPELDVQQVIDYGKQKTQVLCCRLRGMQSYTRWIKHFLPMRNGQGYALPSTGYVCIYEAPLQMLSDSPTLYLKEQECIDFIAKVPVTFDGIVPMDGKAGEYAALARQKGDAWFVGAMTSWTARDQTLAFSFLPAGNYQAEIFRDGMNADRTGTDYTKEAIQISQGQKLDVYLAPGGGRPG